MNVSAYVCMRVFLTSSTHDTFFHHLSSAFNLIVSIVQYPIARFGGIHLACINDAVSELWML